MGCEQMMQRMSFVLKREYLNKAHVAYNTAGMMVVRIDLHGMTRNEATKVIKGVLLLNNGSFILDLIHGYNHGTVLKKMICEDLDNARIGRKWGYEYNHGETFLEINKAY